jgi:hypothetical protein
VVKSSYTVNVHKRGAHEVLRGTVYPLLKVARAVDERYSMVATASVGKETAQ